MVIFYYMVASILIGFAITFVGFLLEELFGLHNLCEILLKIGMSIAGFCAVGLLLLCAGVLVMQPC